MIKAKRQRSWQLPSLVTQQLMEQWLGLPSQSLGRAASVGLSVLIHLWRRICRRGQVILIHQVLH